jgi:hypothetical protein
MEEINENKLRQIAELFSGNLKILNMNPMEALISSASITETIGELYLQELINKKNKSELEIIQIGRLSRILEDSKSLSLQRTLECYIADYQCNIRPENIKLWQNSLISSSLGKRFKLLQKHNFKCMYCGRSPPEVQLELEHIFPKCKGGKDEEDNLGVACRDCNRGKAGNPLNEVCNEKGVESQ